MFHVSLTECRTESPLNDTCWILGKCSKV